MTRRILLLVTIALLAAIATAPAVFAAGDAGLVLATAESEDDGEEMVDEPMTDVIPAVETVEPAEEEEDQPWTSRFLVPTVLAIGALGVVAAAAFYVVRVRGKYRVV
jgi:beta-lactamase regulating signal transducer with metallopeptidase domain